MSRSYPPMRTISLAASPPLAARWPAAKENSARGHSQGLHDLGCLVADGLTFAHCGAVVAGCGRVGGSAPGGLHAVDAGLCGGECVLGHALRQMVRLRKDVDAALDGVDHLWHVRAHGPPCVLRLVVGRRDL